MVSWLPGDYNLDTQIPVLSFQWSPQHWTSRCSWTTAPRSLLHSWCWPRFLGAEVQEHLEAQGWGPHCCTTLVLSVLLTENMFKKERESPFLDSRFVLWCRMIREQSIVSPRHVPKEFSDTFAWIFSPCFFATLSPDFHDCLGEKSVFLASVAIASPVCLVDHVAACDGC